MILGLILFCCSISTGFYIKMCKLNKIKFQLDLLNFCDYLKSQISFSKKPVKEIVLSYGENATSKLKKILNSFCTQIGETQNIEVKCDNLNFEENKIVNTLFQNLGRSDLKNQIELCENTRVLLYSNYEINKEKLKTSGDISFKLSVCLGLLFIVLSL